MWGQEDSKKLWGICEPYKVFFKYFFQQKEPYEALVEVTTRPKMYVGLDIIFPNLIPQVPQAMFWEFPLYKIAIVNAKPFTLI